MNKGIQMDWKYPFEEKKKPAWMPKTGTKAKYYPCDCKKCVFCINKITSSTVAHGKVTAKPVVQQCSGLYESVSRKYCIVCKKEANDKFASLPGMCFDDRMKKGKVKYIRNGCKTCNIAVCKKHWAEFTHNATDYI